MKHHKVWIQRSATPEDAPIPSTWAYRRKLGANNQPALPLSPRSTAGCWNETQTPNPKRLKGLDPCPRHQLEKDPVQSTRDDKNKQLLETPRENEESLLNRTTNQLNNRESQKRLSTSRAQNQNP
ncbi:hypothetical protein PCANC_15226 [Puccinia coronata f. sp. avenae]|uniref:Uncharacterized protein n=1 Tax=Puccinia coronata f. sp. avenae TaxID=200324 RepID=A0A2N5VNK7_9BASI|nr:hypothetical protein PCANC_15226 [Puccinia coronata f. sp. avenae]